MGTGPLVLDGRPVVVLAFDPDVPLLPLLGAGPLALVADGHVDVQGPEPVLRLTFAELAGRGERSLRALRPGHAIVHTLRGASPPAVAAAALCGARAFHLVDAPGSSFLSNARGAIALAAEREARRRLAALPLVPVLERVLGTRVDPPWPTLEATRALAEAAVARAGDGPSRGPGGGRPLRVVHYVTSLGPGGAERQLVYLARASRARGLDVRVLSARPLDGADAHHAPALAEAGVPVAGLAPFPRGRALPALRDRLGRALLDRPQRDLLDRHAGREWLVPLLEALLADPPDVVHAWLDVGNVVGATAALLAGVPRAVASARNVSPAHLPHLDAPWLRDAYRVLAGSPRVTLLANSRAGAVDYAAWCGVASDGFRVVQNGIDAAACRPLGEDERAARRREAWIDTAAFVLAGVFRLSSEKRPLDFVRVVGALRERVPGLVALHVGEGPLEHEVRAEARRLGLEATLRFVGRSAEPWRWLGLADACLLTSEAEGCPNVALEGQALGVPIVLTRAGGAPETIEDGRTGAVCAVGDVVALAERVADLAHDPERRRAMGRAGRERVEARFTIEAMTDETLRAYG